MRLASSLLFAALSATGAAAAPPPFVGVNPGAPIWNGNILLNDALAADIASSGCRFVRVNFRIDGNATWTPQHLAKYDQIVASAKAYNLEILGLVAYEAVAAGQADWNENYNSGGMNPFVNTFADTAWLLIDRYKDDIKLWEVWNEPSCWSVPPSSNPLNPGCFYIWPANYANVLAQTYLRCVQNGGANYLQNNGIAFVTGGLFAHDIGGSFSTASDYMNAVYQQSAVWNAFEAQTGRRYPWDYFGYHFYLNQGEPVSTSELNAYFSNIRFWKDVYNDDTPFMVTEFGWNTASVSTQLQASNLTATYNWMRTQTDITSAMWYQWNNGGNGDWGLTFSLGNPKPSYFAFAEQCGITLPPTADFTSDVVGGDAPLTVAFSNLTVGPVDTYTWSFGDGVQSNATNPSHTYQAPGVYSVTLAATGPGGSDSITKPDYVSVGSVRDFDGDGDVDLHDAAAFALCYTGSGSTDVPAGCACTSGSVSNPATGHQFASSLNNLSATIAANDLLAGVIGVIESGGFFPDVPGGAAGGLSDLTDGAAGAGLEAVLADYSRPALQVRFNLPAATDVGRINVFAANSDGRVFQHYKLEYSAADEGFFRPLVDSVTTGAFGLVNNATYGASLTQVSPEESGPIAANVDALRFTFYNVSTVDPASVFWDPWDPGELGDTDGAPRAYVAPIIKEIDVVAYDGPPLVSNCADGDSDRDVDLSDFDALSEELTGPQ